MTVTLGLSTKYGYNPWWIIYTPAQQLADIDARKNQIAGLVGLGTDWASSKHLYPAIYGLWSDPNVSPVDAGEPAPKGGFPRTELLHGLGQRGIMPMINWSHGAPAYSLNQTWADGGHDAYIDAWSAQANAYRESIVGSRDFGCGWVRPDVILRFWWECNAYWFAWNPNNDKGVPNTDATFKAGWQHIHDRIRIYNGADHVKLYYCGQGGINGTTIRDPKLMFPGDRYVQYNGFDHYTEPGLSPSLVSLLFSECADFLKISSMPLIIGETGVAKSDDGVTRATWWSQYDGVRGLGASVPRLKSLVYFDIDMTAYGEIFGENGEAAHRNWKLDRNPEVLAQYAINQNNVPARMWDP